MKPQTLAMLVLADSVFPKGREEFIRDLIPSLALKKFLTIEDIAERYQVSISAVKTWIAAGKLVPALKIPGGTARYTLADVLNFENKYRKEKE